MWTFLGVIFILFKNIHSFENGNYTPPDMMDILRSEPPDDVSDICKQHLQEYLNGVINTKEWAMKMIDSITKFPDGVLMGHLVIPGHFDECVSAYNENFHGKHCMVQLTFISPKDESVLPKVFTIQQKNDTFTFSYGLCFPSTCHANDIMKLINSLNLDIVYPYVTDNDCSVSGYRPLRTEDWVTIGILIFILIATVGSTAYDLFERFHKNNENPNQLLSAFSVYSNGVQLIRISKSASQLKCLNGIRFLSMCWVILGHSYLSFEFGAPINLTDVPKFMKDNSFIPVSNAFVSVDSFFFLSGLLVCLIFFRDISKKKTFDVPVAFIHRYMRLTPPFAFLMLIQATIISRMGNGPFWNERSDQVEEACRESWWTGILYVQNYLKPTAMCLGQAWYLSADMQMYWVSPLILYPLLWFPSFAPYFILLLLLVAATVNFAVTFVYKLAPNIIMNWDTSILEQFKLEYTPFHTRMAPWIIGLATGYIICGIQAKKIHIKIPKLWVLVGWLAAGFLLGGSLFGISKFFSDDYTQLEASLYLAFHRVGWALGLAWVVIACVSGHGGLVNDILSLEWFEILAKLSYCNFLVHMAVQNYRINTSRTNQYLRHFEIVYSYFGDIVISNLISIPIVLLFEFPFIKIDRYLFQNLKIYELPKPKKESKQSSEKSKKSEKAIEQSQDLEKGKLNPTFSES